MTQVTTKTFEVWDGSNWVELERGKDTFAKVVAAGLPVRIKHTSPRGVSTKIIRNGENAPEEERESVVAWEKPPVKAEKPPAKAKKSGKINPFLGALVASS